MSIKEIVADYIASKNEDKVWKKAGTGTHDRQLTVGASEVGHCLRRIGYDKHPEWNAAKDEEVWGFAERGALFETLVVAALRDSLETNEKLQYAGRHQRTFVHPLLPLSATPDGFYVLGTGKDAVIVQLEIKSIDPRVSAHKLPREEHVIQLKTAMEVVSAANPKMAPERGLLLYIDASSCEVVYEQSYDREPEVCSVAASRAEVVFAATAPSQLIAEGVMDGECKNCPWRSTCAPFTAADNAAELAATLRDRIAPLVTRFLELKRLEDEKDAINAQIKLAITQANEKGAAGPGWLAAISRAAGRKTLDKAAVEALAAKTNTPMSDLEKQGAESVRLTITSK